ncbi:MAG TPA: OmpH family outer membrane protein, partial [Candidatus Prevotella avicola]|nr:OmpH family outer membrane protein [Candidatus Prevotella avicola]
RGDIEAQAKQYENDLKSMQDELTRKSDEYEKGKSTMNATAQQQKEQELQQLYQKIQQAYQDNQQALAQKQQELMQPITTKLVNAIKAVGDKGGYVYIMDLSAGIPYISTTLSKDVTAEVKAQLQ